MQHFGKGALRVAKNYTKGYSDTQAKVREATSNDPWGPSGTQMNEIAQMTYNQGDFVEIMEMLDKRLNDKGKNWRHVFKSLTVLDYCLHAGSENVVIYFKDNLYVIKTLKEFQYVDEEGKDQGANVRQKAKDITNLLMDDARLREERRTRAHMRDRMIRGASGEFEDDGPYSARNRMPPPPQNENAARRRGPRGKDRDEEELRKAIEESKKTLAAEQAKQARDTEERDLARAIKLSEEEEENRRKALEDANEKSLFDDTQQITTQTTNSLLIDPTPYTVGLQPQYTVQPQFTSVQTHFTSFNPYQQQAQQEAMQAEYLRQQQMQLAYQQQQEQQRLQQEEWMRQQYQQQQQQQLMMQQQQQQSQFLQPQPTLQLQPQPTGFGSNNPFAPASHSPSPSSPIGPQLTATPQFNLQGTYANSAGPSFGTSPSPTPASSSSRASSAVPSMTSGMGATASMRKKDEENAALANLFANRDDGMDTFGNVGTLRYGQTGLTVQPTGSHNPFARQQQQQQVNHERPFFDI